MNTNWNYKGLKCNIVNSGSGYIYTVYDIGLITREPMTFIYGGSPNKVTKEDVEAKIDIKIKKGNLKISTQCHNAFVAHELGRCPFANMCEESCKLVEWSETVKELESEIVNLENTLEEQEDCSQELEDLQDEYSDLEYKLDEFADSILEIIKSKDKMSDKLEEISKICQGVKTW